MAQGVIIDLDGTFVDTNQAKASAWVEALREADQGGVEFSQVRALIGLHPEELLVRTLGVGLDSAVGLAARRRAGEIFRRRYLKNLTPFYGATELLHIMRVNGVRISVASFDDEPVLRALLKLLSAEPLINAAVHADNLPGARSNREVLKAATDRLGTPAGRTILITDSPFDVEAARHLNIPTIAFSSGGFGRDLGANVLYENAEALLASYEESPLALAG